MAKKTPVIIFFEPGTVKTLVQRLPLPTVANVLCHETEREAAQELGTVIAGYSEGWLAPCREDMTSLGLILEPFKDRQIIVPTLSEQIPPHVRTTLALLGFSDILELTPTHSHMVHLPAKPNSDSVRSLLLKACGGIGNVVLLTPLLHASLSQGWKTTFCPVSDLNGGSLGELFRGDAPSGLSIVEPDKAIHASADVILNVEANTLRSPLDFHHNPYRIGAPGHEPAFAARFFENVTGVAVDISNTFVGGTTESVPRRLRHRIVICPGSKPSWDSKRWPHMNALLRKLEDPLILCKKADLAAYRDLPFLTPITARNAEFLTDLNLFQAASLLRSAKAVVANDCGMAHVAAAAGVPTLILFGPSSLEKNRHHRANVLSLSLGLECQPCQGATSGPGRLGPGAYSCLEGYRCFAELSVETVLDALDTAASFPATTRNSLGAEISGL